MTTNVRDSQSGLVATDSRWTWTAVLPDGTPHTSFHDDTGYEKILLANGFVFMFAGDAYVIEQWKQPIKHWSYTKQAVDWGSLKTDGMAISIVQQGSGKVIFENNHEIKLDTVSFAGTGSYGAAVCWNANRCAKRAVETAKLTDPHTGGTVKFHNALTGESNIGTDVDLNTLIRKFTGGRIMAGELSNTTTVGEVAAAHEPAANDDAKIQQAFLDAYARGQGPKAPCDAVFGVWPAEEKAKLVRVMEQIFAL